MDFEVHIMIDRPFFESFSKEDSNWGGRKPQTINDQFPLTSYMDISQTTYKLNRPWQFITIVREKFIVMDFEISIRMKNATYWSSVEGMWMILFSWENPSYQICKTTKNWKRYTFSFRFEEYVDYHVNRILSVTFSKCIRFNWKRHVMIATKSRDSSVLIFFVIIVLTNFSILYWQSFQVWTANDFFFQIDSSMFFHFFPKDKILDTKEILSEELWTNLNDILSTKFFSWKILRVMGHFVFSSIYYVSLFDFTPENGHDKHQYPGTKRSGKPVPIFLRTTRFVFWKIRLHYITNRKSDSWIINIGIQHIVGRDRHRERSVTRTCMDLDAGFGLITDVGCSKFKRYYRIVKILKSLTESGCVRFGICFRFFRHVQFVILLIMSRYVLAFSRVWIFFVMSRVWDQVEIVVFRSMIKESATRDVSISISTDAIVLSYVSSEKLTPLRCMENLWISLEFWIIMIQWSFMSFKAKQWELIRHRVIVTLLQFLCQSTTIIFIEYRDYGWTDRAIEGFLNFLPGLWFRDDYLSRYFRMNTEWVIVTIRHIRVSDIPSSSTSFKIQRLTFHNS